MTIKPKQTPTQTQAPINRAKNRPKIPKKKRKPNTPKPNPIKPDPYKPRPNPIKPRPDPFKPPPGIKYAVFPPKPDPFKPDPFKPNPFKPDPFKPPPGIKYAVFPPKPDPFKPDPFKPNPSEPYPGIRYAVFPPKPGPFNPDPIKPNPKPINPGFDPLKPYVPSYRYGAISPGTNPNRPKYGTDPFKNPDFRTAYGVARPEPRGPDIRPLYGAPLPSGARPRPIDAIPANATKLPELQHQLLPWVAKQGPARLDAMFRGTLSQLPQGHPAAAAIDHTKALANEMFGLQQLRAMPTRFV